MKAGYFQNHPRFGDKAGNLADAGRRLKGITADLIVLPELFATGYTFTSREKVAALAEGPDGETAAFLKRISLETGAAIVAGFAEKEGGECYNSCMLVDNGDVKGVYRKLHLFNKEKLLFSPGNMPLQVHQVHGAGVGMMICFDWIFPEVCRTLALKGAEVIAHPANLVMPYCQKAMVTRCLENRVFAVTANRIGREQRGDDDFVFTGTSQVVSTTGEVLSAAPTDSVFMDFVEIDPKESRDKRIDPHNDLLADRREDFYSTHFKYE